jgi:hypothetical protein
MFFSSQLRFFLAIMRGNSLYHNLNGDILHFPDRSLGQKISLLDSPNPLEYSNSVLS